MQRKRRIYWYYNCMIHASDKQCTRQTLFRHGKRNVEGSLVWFWRVIFFSIKIKRNRQSTLWKKKLFEMVHTTRRYDSAVIIVRHHVVHSTLDPSAADRREGAKTFRRCFSPTVTGSRHCRPTVVTLWELRPKKLRYTERTEIYILLFVTSRGDDSFVR